MDLESMSQVDVFSAMDGIQNANKAPHGVARPEFPHLEVYPDCADELPDVIRNFAYECGEVLTVVDLPELDGLLCWHQAVRWEEGPCTK